MYVNAESFNNCSPIVTMAMTDFTADLLAMWINRINHEISNAILQGDALPSLLAITAVKYYRGYAMAVVSRSDPYLNGIFDKMVASDVTCNRLCLLGESAQLCRYIISKIAPNTVTGNIALDKQVLVKLAAPYKQISGCGHVAEIHTAMDAAIIAGESMFSVATV